MKPPMLLTAREAVARLQREPTTTTLLARGRVLDHPPRALVGFFELSERPRPLLRAYLTLDDEEEVFQTLSSTSSVRRGGWNDGTVFWLDDQAGFSLWSADTGLCWELLGDVLVSPTRSLSGILAVEAFASEDWVEQGVRVCLAGQAPVVLLSVRNVRAELGFGYDGLDLGVDMSWAVRVAQALAAKLGVDWVRRF